MSHRVRKLLASKGPLEFGEIFDGVQPAGKFAVRSTLSKGRERKDIKYQDGKYALLTK